MVEANVAPEVIEERKAELRKRELLEAGRRGFEILMPSDFDAETFAPWRVRLSDGSVWKRKQGSPPEGYTPEFHCIVISEGGSWFYLTAARATGADSPRSLAELEERKRERDRRMAEKAKADAEALKAKRATAEPVVYDDLVRDGQWLTLRQSGEAVLAAGGSIRVVGSRLVVSLPPGASMVLGVESSAARGAKRLYLAEVEVVAAAGRGGEVAPSKLPAKAILPSGRLVP
jgi:hypothetical protein